MRPSEAEAAQAGMIVGSAAESPAKFPVLLADRHVVDGRVACGHESLGVELPVLVAERAEPVARVVLPLVRESHRDAIVLERPQLLDESVVELAVPLATKKRHDLLATDDELGSIPPPAVDAVGASHSLGLARIPAVLRRPHLVDRCV